MVGCAFNFLPFIEKSGIEDKINLLFYKPLNMSMGQFSRIAL